MVLVTGDSDFGPVFRRLRELGKGVVGVGPTSVLSTSVALSCHDFIFTDDGSGSRKRGMRAGKNDRGFPGVTGGGIGVPAAGMMGTRVMMPPQMLSARGGFRMRHQGFLPMKAVYGLKPERLDSWVSREERSRATATLERGAAPQIPGPSDMMVLRAATPGLRARGPVDHADRRAATAGLRGEGPIDNANRRAAPVSVKGEGPVDKTKRHAAPPGLEAKGPVDLTAVVYQTQPTPQQHQQPQQPLPRQRLPQHPLSSQRSRTQSPQASSSTIQRVVDGTNANVSTETPLLAPGQLLIPEMLTKTEAAETGPPRMSQGLSSAVVEPAAAAATSSGVKVSQPRVSRTPGACAGAAAGSGANGGDIRAQTGRTARNSGLGALSVVRPSEKLYRHLLALGSTTGDEVIDNGNVDGLPSVWGNDLSEVTLAKGLVSLAGACGGSDDEQACAVAALEGFVSNGEGGEGGGGVSGGLGREDAFCVARLLQRCGFLSWIPDEQQWLVTIPADMEVLRRRRDEAMMEELLTKCQEAGVPFEPSLASNLLWSKESHTRKWS